MYCTMMHVNFPYLGRQEKFGDQRPFTREGNYLVIQVCIAASPSISAFLKLLILLMCRLRTVFHFAPFKK